MTTYSTDGKSGPWAEEKWKCLQDYLESYTKVLLNTNFRKYYIDAFAGTGIAQIRKPLINQGNQLPITIDIAKDPEFNEFAKGSPLRALDLTHPFDGYLFVEPDKHRAEQLRKSIQANRNFYRCRIREATADAALRERVINNPLIDWRQSRAVCFLDPFGMQVDWRILRELASTRSIEVIINFPLGTTIRRHLQNTGALPKGWVERLDQFFGTHEWYDVVYQQTENFFGSEVQKVPRAELKLLDWYLLRLESLFGYAASPRLVRNSYGTDLYYILWAGPHAKGREIADYILSGMAKQ